MLKHAPWKSKERVLTRYICKLNFHLFKVEYLQYLLKLPF